MHTCIVLKYLRIPTQCNVCVVLLPEGLGTGRGAHNNTQRKSLGVRVGTAAVPTLTPGMRTHLALPPQIYKHGCWQQVSVDNYLPCLPEEERLAFACSAVVGELWPSMLEKAYAKVRPRAAGLCCARGACLSVRPAHAVFVLAPPHTVPYHPCGCLEYCSDACRTEPYQLCAHRRACDRACARARAQIHGSYYSLAGGSVSDALVDLTGGVAFKVKVDSPAGVAAAADGSLWQDIQSWLASGCIVACRWGRAAAWLAGRLARVRRAEPRVAVNPHPGGSSWPAHSAHSVQCQRTCAAQQQALCPFRHCPNVPAPSFVCAPRPQGQA